MNTPTILLLTLGEWLEANAIGIIVAAVSWLVTAGGFLWAIANLFASHKELGKKVDSHTNALDDLYSHTTDANVHTTFEFRQSVNAQFTEIKADLHSGQKAITEKIDRLMEKIYSK